MLGCLVFENDAISNQSVHVPYLRTGGDRFSIKRATDPCSFSVGEKQKTYNTKPLTFLIKFSIRFGLSEYY